MTIITYTGGYRSVVAYFDDNLILACGKDSCDYADPIDDGFKVNIIGF